VNPAGRLGDLCVFAEREGGVRAIEEGDNPEVLVSVDLKVKLESPGPERVSVESEGPILGYLSNPIRRAAEVVHFGASNTGRLP